MARLHAIEIGHGPEPMVFLHGVFGQGKNFGVIAKMLADQASSVLLDLPNHGRSPWTQHFDYDQFADLVADELVLRDAETAPVTLVGHSMGGKVAMRLALRHPTLLTRLVIADISPVARGEQAEFIHLAEALLNLELTGLTTRNQADDRLRAAVPDDAVRAFLLQNLHRQPGTAQQWRWLPNLELLRRSAGLLTGWPPIAAHWDGPVLWLAGERSRYVQAIDEPVMAGYFPQVRLEEIPESGHWVHADQPKAVAAALAHFIATTAH